ncbi:inactive rhomboid protein 1-like isoform X2 [Gigantopelta aegis]|uniref:inactive rhomboid protein 1-like isoform X2 n=1 Tax=Gigantopelta aegis TaxID=1735272 RepID=UPI001B88AE30|nr:inactive rhomboid protein 1-like isoform X2 [Gigantopelta aegis]
MDSAYNRQISRLTTASAPPTSGAGGEPASGSRMKRFGRYMKSSVADFFGVGEEDCSRSDRWDNRRKRYAGSIGKLKEELIHPEDELDSASPRIIDPLRVPGRHISETDRYSRRTTPLSSTSTYRRGYPGTPRSKDSVIKMTWQGISTLAGVKRKLRQKQAMKSRSYAPASLAGDIPDEDLSVATSQPVTDDAISLVDDVFYDEPLPGSGDYEPSRLDKIREESEATDRGESGYKPAPGWRRMPPQALPSTPGVGMDEPDFPLKRIAGKVMHTALEREKRHLGMGFVGRLLKRSFKSERYQKDDVLKQMDSLDDHRPYFTYWVTFVQIVCFIVAVAVYGIAPVGISVTVYSETVRMPNLAFQKEDQQERDNLWIGPRQADLIHLGAKYSPCMRWDENLNHALNLDLQEEKTSACCVRNDGSGCAQMTEKRCSPVLSSFEDWGAAGNSGPNDRKSGSVCGQDPRFCTDPASVPPFEWEDDITKWPLCLTTDRPNVTQASTQDRHMTCEVVGHPCCHGIQGECIITTREHCDLKRGYYHENAYLCSQVKCMEQICGMIAFTNPDNPDQFYRLWTSLFLHGGLFHLLITIIFQMLVMRDMEKLTGAIRMAIIYIASGIAGNLASCIFLPYQVEAGPSGSQFGILACLLVEVLQSWQMYRNPLKAILKLGIPILILFLLGLLPWFDNWAHLFGFIFGVLLAFALLPYVSFGKFDRRRKIIGIVVCLSASVGLFVLLVILFYVVPITECEACQYFNCIPFTADFCTNMQVSIKRNSTYSKF